MYFNIYSDGYYFCKLEILYYISQMKHHVKYAPLFVVRRKKKKILLQNMKLTNSDTIKTRGSTQTRFSELQPMG